MNWSAQGTLLSVWRGLRLLLRLLFLCHLLLSLCYWTPIGHPFLRILLPHSGNWWLLLWEEVAFYLGLLSGSVFNNPESVIASCLSSSWRRKGWRTGILKVEFFQSSGFPLRSLEGFSALPLRAEWYGFRSKVQFPPSGRSRGPRVFLAGVLGTPPVQRPFCNLGPIWGVLS